jgi:two-component system KDP operon response regulator KdpE
VTEAMFLVLVVEDDRDISAVLRTLLEAEQYRVVVAETGERAVIETGSHRPDLVLLDLGLPDRDGQDVIREIRTFSSVPIVVLSARTMETERVRALDAGADDYVTKPFGPEELLARIRAALRRVEGAAPASEAIVRGDLVIDRARFRVLRNGEEVRLTPKEFELLSYLAQRPGRVLTHRAILRAIWGPQSVDQPEHLRVLIGSLRKKIEPNPSTPQYILTEPWVGYRFMDMA